MSFAFLPLYTGDYRRDTQHLSMLEHGAFCLLLMHSWDAKGPVPLDERRQFAICNARSNEEMGAVRNVLGEFFIRMDDGWYNKRMQREIERANSISGARSDAGKKGYQAKAKQLLSKRLATAKQVPLPPPPQSQPPLQPQPEKPLALQGSAYPPGFTEFWQAFPRKRAKDDAYKAWKQIRPNREMLDLMLAAVAVQKLDPRWIEAGGQYIPYPASWLKKGQWKDEPDTVASADEALMASITADPRFKDCA